MNKIKTNYFKRFLIILSLSVLLVGCQSKTVVQEDIKEIVSYYSGNTQINGVATITPTELIVVEDKKELKYNLPKNEFFVSIAPYITKTHPCTIHNLTGCQGELTNIVFDVVILNSDGEEIINEKISSKENGFIDLWLPRNEEFEIQLSYAGKSAKSIIKTRNNSNTCVTSIQLKI